MPLERYTCTELLSRYAAKNNPLTKNKLNEMLIREVKLSIKLVITTKKRIPTTIETLK